MLCHSISRKSRFIFISFWTSATIEEKPSKIQLAPRQKPQGLWSHLMKYLFREERIRSKTHLPIPHEKAPRLGKGKESLEADGGSKPRP